MAIAAAALVLLGLNAGLTPSADPAGSNGLSIRKTGALQAVADLRARLERNAQSEPLARLRQAMGATPSATELNGCAMASLLAGAPANALIVLTEAARKAQDDFLSFNNLGALLNNLGQYDAARIFLLYAAELSPDNPMVLSNLGVAELGKGNDKEAEALFLSAVARAPRHPEANYALGRMAGRRGDDQAAERYLSASLDGAYTDRAARALRSLERSSKTRTGRRAAPAGPPPPVPAQAAKAGKDLRLVLPVIEAGSLPDFVAAEKVFSAAARVAQAIGAPIALEMRGFLDPRALASSKMSGGSTGTMLRLGDGKARRAHEQTNRWYALLMDTDGEFGHYETDLLKRMATISAEQTRLWDEEQKKCYALTGRAREACLEEAERRACGRYFAAFEPLLGEYHARYAEFRPRWEDAARGYLQYAFYTASLMSDPIEAKGFGANARLEVARQFMRICSFQTGMCNAFGPPTDRCF
ncbi:MAG: hypothetical protein HGA94_03995, partial [Candidatus Aminicenantes bacterium]|nr:hypothetical protein [Candidatus Aminicenantes bacterium]